MPKIHNLHILRSRRKELRNNPTPQEEKLWEYLKGKRIGSKFRRQHSVGGYILDFYNHEKKFIIEIDGGVHISNEAREYDAVRDKYFTDLGYVILRFPNYEIDNNIDEVLMQIKSRLN